MTKLKLGLPKGSLQEATVKVFERAGYKVHVSEDHIFRRLMIQKLSWCFCAPKKCHGMSSKACWIVGLPAQIGY
jgi:hypothetical protein